MPETKEEILHRLKTSRQLNTMENTKDWKAAFDLYNATVGARLSMKCGKCFSKVSAWIQGIKE